MLLGLEASQLKLPESRQCPFPPFFMSFLWPCGLLLGKGLTVEVLRVMDLPLLLSGESCVCAQVGVCVYVRVCLRVEGMEHTETQALRERGWSLGLRKPGVRVVEGRRVVGVQAYFYYQSLGCEGGVLSLTLAVSLCPDVPAWLRNNGALFSPLRPALSPLP